MKWGIDRIMGVFGGKFFMCCSFLMVMRCLSCVGEVN